MAQIDIEFIGPLRRPWPEHARALEIAGNPSVAELLGQLGYADEECRLLTILVNDKKVRPTHRLAPNDKLTLTLMVGGG